MAESVTRSPHAAGLPALTPEGAGDGLTAGLGLLVQLAMANLGCSTEVSFSLRRTAGGAREPLAASSEQALALDAVQLGCGLGPGCDAFSGGCEAAGLLPDDRWPELSEAAARHGVRAVWALPVGPGEAPSGCLTLYGETAEPWPGAQASTARLLAGLAEVLAADSRTVAQLGRGNETLQQALETRTVIGQAQGILMARQGIGASAAFDVLRRASQRSNRKLRDIAAELVAGVGRPAAAPAPRRPR